MTERFAEVELTLADLHQYQVQAKQFALDNPFCALWMGLGLGKTGTMLAYIAELLGTFEYNKVLIVGTLKIVNQTWPAEIRKWRHSAAFDYQLITGEMPLPERIEATKSPALIHIVNVDQLDWLCDQWNNKWPYDIVIIDESSAFKSHASSRFKALRKKRKGAVRTIRGVKEVRPMIKRMVQLTASPATEGYEGLFTQLFLLDLGKRLGKFITHYLTEYFTRGKYDYKYSISDTNKNNIVNRIRDIVLVMKREDYFEFEAPVVSERRIVLSDAEMKLYKHMKRESMLTLESGIEIEAKFAASLSGKLAQMASGAVYDEVGAAHHVHDRKIEELKQLVEESQDETLLVAYWFKSSLDRLTKAFPKAVVMDKKGSQVDKWNKRKIKMMFVHPRSAGHGLNLQKGGHNLVFFDLPWSLELYEQIIGRLDRQGQANTVVVHHLIAKGTVDEAIFTALKEKRDVQEELFALLRGRARVKPAETHENGDLDAFDDSDAFDL